MAMTWWPGSPRPLALVLLVVAVSLPGLYVLGRGIALFSLPWWQHLSSTVLPGYLWNSLVVGGTAVAWALALGAVPAWMTVRYEFAGRAWCVFIQLLPLTMPAYVAAGLFQEAWHDEFFESRAALALELGAAAAPMAFLFLRVALSRMPASVFEVSASLGCGRLERVRHVALPLLGAPLVAAGALVAAEAIGDFGAASRVGIATLSVGLHQQWHGLQRPELAHMLALILFLLALLLATPLIRLGLRYQRANDAADLRPLVPRTAGWPTTLVFHLVCLATVLPGFWAPLGLAVDWALARRAAVRPWVLAVDAGNTLLIAVSCAALCLLATLAFACLLRFGAHTRRSDRSIWLVSINYLTPSAVLALAWLGGALTGHAVIILATTVKLLPLMLLPFADAAGRLSSAQLECARSLGCSRLQALRHAVLPQLLPVLAGGALLVFVLAATELTLALTLQPFGFSSLSLRIFAYAGIQMTQLSSLWVLCLVLLCVYPIWRLASLTTSPVKAHA